MEAELDGKKEGKKILNIINTSPVNITPGFGRFHLGGPKKTESRTYTDFRLFNPVTMDQHYLLATLLLFLLPKAGLVQEIGSQDHPMNKLTENISILNYWEEQNPLLNKLYLTVDSILSKSKKADYSDVITDLNYLKHVVNNDIKILGGPMLGDVRSDGISIWIRTSLPANVKVKIANFSFEKVFGPQLTSVDEDLTTIFKIDGLQSNTKYFYSLEINDENISPLDNKCFTTAASEKSTNQVRISFGSCPHRWGLGHPELWNRIKSREPDAMLVLGDIAVQDRNDHLGKHRADYLCRDLQKPWADFVSRVPMYASWDDHDYFDNDKAGIPEGFVQEDKDGVRKVFKDSWNNPSYGLGQDGKGIFTKTRIGQCDVIMTDNRYFRKGGKGSFLGDEQMDWLKEELLKCKGPFILLSCGSMWSDFTSNGKDSWGVNDPDGREDLFSFIEDNNIGGVVFVSGDRHGARGFTIPRPSGMEFYEFEAASLGGRVGPPAKDPSWDTQLYGYDAVFAFGELTIHPENEDPFFIYRLIQADGKVLFEKKVFRSQLVPGNF